jgi:hypothetical protein
VIWLEGSKPWALSEELMWAVPFSAPARKLCGTALRSISTAVPGSLESEPERVHFDLV